MPSQSSVLLHAVSTEAISTGAVTTNVVNASAAAGTLRRRRVGFGGLSGVLMSMGAAGVEGPADAEGSDRATVWWMLNEPEVVQTPLQQVRDHLHSTDRDHTTQGQDIPAAHAARRTADPGSRAHELGQDALTHADEGLALKALWLIHEMDDVLLRAQAVEARLRWRPWCVPRSVGAGSWSLRPRSLFAVARTLPVSATPIARAGAAGCARFPGTQRSRWPARCASSTADDPTVRPASGPERFDHRVVVAVPNAAHRRQQPAGLGPAGEGPGTELNSMI